MFSCHAIIPINHEIARQRCFVGTSQMWPNWVAPNGEGAAESPSGCIGEGPQRLLLGRTLAALGDRWPVESGAVTADDVADTQGASECFSRLLQVRKILH